MLNPFALLAGGCLSERCTFGEPGINKTRIVSVERGVSSSGGLDAVKPDGNDLTLKTC